MSFWLWGSVNPRWTDIIYATLFPAGYLTPIYNLILLCIGLLDYVLVFLVWRKNKSTSNLSELSNLPIIGWGFFFGLFLCPIAVIWSASYLWKNSLAYLEINRIPNFTPKKRFLLGFLRLLNIAWIIVVPAYTYEMSSYRMYGYISYILGGWAIMAGFVIFRRIQRKPLKHRNWNPTPSTRKLLYVSALITLMVATSIYSIGIFYKPHSTQIPPLVGNQGTTLRMMSYNIRLATIETDPANNWEQRREMMANYLDSFDLDLIGIQEALLPQVDYLIANLQSRHYTYTGFGRNDDVHGGEHAAILFDQVKFRFIDGDTFWLSDIPDLPTRTWGNGHYRVCTWVILEYRFNGTQFCVFNTHYDGGASFNINATQLIHERLTLYAKSLPVIVCGDFNMLPTESAYKIMTNFTQTVPLQDSFAVFYNNTNPFEYTVSHFNISNIPSKSYRIDYIFISSGVKVQNFTVPKHSYDGVHTYSDHYPLFMIASI